LSIVVCRYQLRCWRLLQMFYLLSFFFYCYGHHRDLHSFPTRRSSDLLGVERSHVAGYSMGGRLALHLTTRRPDRVLSLLTIGAQDRKSTRLNSSHVKISYAVFCLKKKKKKTTQS